MPTVTYDWNLTQGSFTVNTTLTSGNQGLPAIAATNGGLSYYNGWFDGTGAVYGEGFSNTAISASDEVLVNGETTNVQTDPSIDQLIPQGFLASPGAIVVTYTDYSVDAGGDIRARLISGGPGILGGSAYGTLLSDVSVNTSTSNDSDSDVAALADGGFVVTFTRDFGGGDLDVAGTIMNANGTVRTDIFINSSISLSTSGAQVAGLTNGNFVVVWQQEPAAGGDSEVWFQILNSSGGVVVASTLIDTFGSHNEDIQVVALADGGFAVAYEDNGWGTFPLTIGSGIDISLAIYDADGTLRPAGIQLVNTAVAGGQLNPTLTTLSNGYIVVGWSEGASLMYQAFSPAGAAAGTNTSIAGSVIEAEIAGLSGGLIANVRASSVEETVGSGDSIRSSINELTRIALGDATNEVIVGDALRDNFSGGGGNDILTGALNVDTLTGGAGLDIFRDTLSGLNGDTITDLSIGDRIHFANGNAAAFTFTLSGSTLTYSGGSLTLSASPNGQLGARAAPGGGVELAVVSPLARTGDFNGDGRSDILWRNDSGTVTDWLGLADGTFFANGANAFINAVSAWRIVGTGDFNGDGRDDVLWRNDNGTVTNWLGQPNGSFAGNDANVSINVDSTWEIVSTGDFNGDGRDDVLWRNENGTVTNWLGQANGGFVGNSGNAYINVDSSWYIIGTGDFNGDGREDVLWRNLNGTVTEWLGQANGGFVDNGANAYINVESSWTAAGIGDFNGGIL